MIPPVRKYGEDDDEYAARVEHLNRQYRIVKIGYIAAGAAFVLALFCFIMGIASGVAEISGVGGIFMIGAVVTGILTGVYHGASGLYEAQKR